MNSLEMTRAAKLLVAGALLLGVDLAAADTNGCLRSTAVDLRGQQLVVITNNANAYTPACVLISRNATVNFSMQFAPHPLRGGLVVNGVATLDPTSPVPSVDSGTSVNVPFPNAGTFGYYCEVHVDFGMYGAIFVDDPNIVFNNGFE